VLLIEVLIPLRKRGLKMTDGFQNWRLLWRLAVEDMQKHGNFPAVYAMRDSTTQEMLKFGSTGELRKRVFGNYLGGIGGSTTQRIHEELFAGNMITRVELAWLETKDKANAARKESEFRDNHKKVHGRRPTWDQQG
jgi:hypothetical protein